MLPVDPRAFPAAIAPATCAPLSEIERLRARARDLESMLRRCTDERRGLYALGQAVVEAIDDGCPEDASVMIVAAHKLLLESRGLLEKGGPR